MKRFLLLALTALPAWGLDFQDPQAVIAAAVQANPTLARMRAEADAVRERVVPAASLPNPMLMSGVQNKQIDLSDDEMMTMYMVGISQTLIRPDKRNARRDAASLSAEAAEKELASARASVERDVLLAWYELAATDEQLQATANVREMIAAVIAAARVRYEVGAAAQADVIRAQLQGGDLDHEILRLRAARRTALARLLPLLDLPVTTEVPPVRMPENTEDLAIDAPAVPPDDHPAIQALEAQVARAEEDLRLVRLETRPDLELEAQYGYRATQTDMFSLTARIELPLRAKQLTEPRVREAMLRRDAAKLRIAELRRSLIQAMAEAVVAHEEATNQLRFHRDVLVPQAQLAFESTLAAYQTGRAAFDAILSTEAAYLRLRLQYFDFLSLHAQAVANYEALRRGATSLAPMAGSAPAAAGGAGSPSTTSSMGSMSS